MRSPSKEIQLRLSTTIRAARAEGLGEEETGRRLLEIRPHYPPGLLALGSARLTADDLDAAEPLLWQALAGAPTNPGYYFPLSALYRERGDDEMVARLVMLAIWKVSFYEEIPEGLAIAIAKAAPSFQEKQNPEVYVGIAEQMGADLKGPWPDRLLPYHLLNEVQKQAEGGLDPDLIREITANGAACAPVFEAAVREVYEQEQSTLSIESESLLTALLGEIGSLDLLDDFVHVLLDPSDVYLHSQWAAFRVGQRFPAEAFERLRAIGREKDPFVRMDVAQLFYLLRENGDARAAVRELADSFSFEWGDEMAAQLLLTITTVLDLMGGGNEAMEIAQRHARGLSQAGGRFLRELRNPKREWAPGLIGAGIDELDLDGVCVDLALLAPEEDAHEDDEEFDEPEPDVRSPAPGRNDPCWCGSGKKYKKCHLQQDEEDARQEQANEPQATLVDAAWAELLDASAHYNSRAETHRAIEAFTGCDVAEEIGAEELADSGFFDWYLFGYRSERNGRTVIEEFLRRRGERLTEEMRALLESWKASRYALWQVTRIESDRGADIRDVFEGDTIFVENAINEDALGTGGFLIHRVHYLGGKWQFVGNGFLVSEEAAAAIQEEVHTAAEFRERAREWRLFVLEEQADDVD